MIFRAEEVINKNYKGKRALGIDYGNERIGLAISDLEWNISFPLKVLKSHGVFDPLLDIIKENSVGLIVIGLPVSLNGGQQGKQLEKVKKFATKLSELIEEKGLEIDIIYWDERLSTSAASRVLQKSGANLSAYRKNVDKIAASFILQGFLDYVRFHQ